jgi:alkylated DNA repair dioxygenase AlkB
MDYDNYTSYEGPQLAIDIHDGFLTAEQAAAILTTLVKEAPFKRTMTSARRNKLIFGNEDYPEYTIVYRGKTIKTPVLPWSRLPVLRDIRDRVSRATGQPYNTCVIQMYSSGSVGIKPHKDKEVDPGTLIASVSLGETRTMRFERGSKKVDIPLAAGTLCLIRPPTNNFWMHSIPVDDTKKVRASLVFRNFTI